MKGTCKHKRVSAFEQRSLNKEVWINFSTDSREYNTWSLYTCIYAGITGHGMLLYHLSIQC